MIGQALAGEQVGYMLISRQKAVNVNTEKTESEKTELEKNTVRPKHYGSKSG